MFEFDDEMQDSRQVLCERCRKFVQISDIKYLPKGNDSKMAICKNCLKTFGIPGSQIKKTLSDGATAMQPYFCARCNYKFKFNASSRTSLRCPYCGKSDKITEEKARSTAQLLKENSDF
jgi:hypothetical protein